MMFFPVSVGDDSNIAASAYTDIFKVTNKLGNVADGFLRCGITQVEYKPYTVMGLTFFIGADRKVSTYWYG